MNLRTILPAAAGLLVGLMAVPLASRANGNSDISRRSWINTLNSELKAGIDDDAVKTNPLPLALFGVAQSMMPAPQALDAVQRIDERHFLVRHQNS
jgi:hypothetical protein